MKLRQRVSNVFIISAELILLLGTSPLFQIGWTRVEQKFSLFFRDAPMWANLTLYFASHGASGCKTTFEARTLDSCRRYRALLTRFRSGIQLPIWASSSSPARMGPTPEGVPVKITSPGNKVSAWLANETMSPTE